MFLTNRTRLGELFVEHGDLTTDQIEDGLREHRASGRPLGRCLVELGHATEASVLERLAEQLSLESIDLGSLEIDPNAARRLPADFAREHSVLPVDVVGGRLRLATSDPGNVAVIEDARLLSGLEIEEVVAGSDEIRRRIEEVYKITVESVIDDFTAAEGDASSDTLHDIEVMANEPTVVNLVNVIISAALRERASDVHLVPFEGRLELRYRIDGVLLEMPPPPRQLHAALISRIKIMAQMNIAERFIPQDGHFQIRNQGKRVDVRVGTMPTIYGESAVLRLLEKDSETQSLVELGMNPEEAAKLLRIVDKPYGIVLSTGPTGSGKTTTLYSVLSSIYTTEKKILTIEDPVEYELPGVAQIPVRPNRGFTFATGLRAILRQDPDVIMVGEIRDAETAEIAIRAALTGHLVFSTLHTNDAAGAVTRLLDMGIEPFLIASSLEAAIAQRLVRKNCLACKAEIEITDAVRVKMETLGIAADAGQLFRGAGCDRCRGTGYSGRVALFELLILTPEVRQLVTDKRPSTEIKDVAVRDMRSLRDAGVATALSGLTSLDEVLRVSVGEGAER